MKIKEVLSTLWENTMHYVAIHIRSRAQWKTLYIALMNIATHKESHLIELALPSWWFLMFSHLGACYLSDGIDTLSWTQCLVFSGVWWLFWGASGGQGL